MNIAIKGHPTRGKEVIQLLEMLGGDNSYSRYCGYNTSTNTIYYIDFSDRNFIKMIENPSNNSDFIVFTIEEFEEKFPYKIGDKVKNSKVNDFVGEIINVRWDNNEEQIIYVVEWYDVTKCTLNYFARGLQPYKEETMEAKETLVQIDLTREMNVNDEIEVILGDYEFVLKDGKTYFVKKQPQYPKTFIEVLNFWHPNRLLEDDYQRSYKKDLIEKFQDLLYARDAYWKIASDWKPDWCNENKLKYCIECSFGTIDKTVSIVNGCFLAFPTKEMRDAFYENFKDLIESVKEFL